MSEWVAGVPWSSGTSFAGRLSKFGGTLSLTGDALVFKPLGGLGRRREVALTDISEVAPFADKPPRLQLKLNDRSELVYMVLPRRKTTMASADTSARDDAVQAIRAALR